jgi:hypothetical protein
VLEELEELAGLLADFTLPKLYAPPRDREKGFAPEPLATAAYESCQYTLRLFKMQSFCLFFSKLAT